MMRLLVSTAAVLPDRIRRHRRTAQRGGRGGGARRRPREAAAIDLTGYWVSVITEDWKYRMVTPKKGVLRHADAERRRPEGRRHLGPGARRSRRRTVQGLRRRQHHAACRDALHITWQDANTLRIDTDAGTQTRLFHFGTARRPESRAGRDMSVAQWEVPRPGRGGARQGNLKVVTTNLRPGYVRKNGAPYSDKTVVTEYFDVNTMPNGDQWMTVTTKVEDPVYFTRPYITTSDFKKLPDAAGWNPTPCSVK